MKASFLALGLLLALSAGPLAAHATLPPVEAAALDRLNKSPRHGEWVVVDAGRGDKVDLWVVYPERKEKAPVVLVVHEIFGLTDWARAVADAFAAEGFIAIAPDFLSGKGPDGKGSRALPVDQARALNSALAPDEVFRRLDAAAKYGTSLPAARPEYGWWVSVGAAPSASATQPGSRPSRPQWSTTEPPPPRRPWPPSRRPYWVSTEAMTPASTPPCRGRWRSLSAWASAMRLRSTEGAGHGFLRQLEGQAGANLKAAESAWHRTLDFLRLHLEATKAARVLPAVPSFQTTGNLECDPLVCGPEDCAPASTKVALKP